jgi:transposase
VPQVADEAIRALSRARAEAIQDLQAATCRLNALLRRHDSRDTGRATWGPAPRRWLAAVVCATPAPPRVFQADGRAVNAPTDRRQRLAHARHAPVQTWRLQPVIEALHAVRGVPGTVAVTSVAERGELTRVDHPRPLMRDFGLTPAAYASGERRRQGAITTTGHTPARRALMEGAGAYRYPAQVSRHLQRRLETLPTPRQEIRGTAQVRRGPRDRKRCARGTPANQVVVAIARALIACMWAIAREVPLTRSTQTGARSAFVLTHG